MSRKTMERTKNGIKALSFVLVVTIALTSAQTVSASTSYRMIFGCCAAGNSFVLWNFLWADPAIPQYVEPASGFISCCGSARVEEDAAGFPYAAWEPGSVCCIGSLAARWTHGKGRYELRIVFYSADQTVGVFWPEGDYFAIGSWLPPSILTMMEFRGMLIEDGKPWRIWGGALLVVLSHQYDYTPPEAETISLLLFIDLGEELPDDERWFLAAVSWVDRDVTLPPVPEPLPIDAAQVFYHCLRLLNS